MAEATTSAASWSLSLSRLEWRPGGVEEIKAQQEAPAVLKVIEEAGMLGIVRQELKNKVGGRPVDVDVAAKWLVSNGKVVEAKEHRLDAAGRQRGQVVSRCV